MPHLDLHFNMRDLSDNDITVMANALSDVLQYYLTTSDDAVSIAMTSVSADDWKEQVYDPIIAPTTGDII